MVDDSNYDDVSRFRWYRFKRARNRTAYAYRFVQRGDNPRGAWEYMHKRITGHAQTDHINGNGLDNRRENLRDASDSSNRSNTPKQRGKYSSQYKGVCWDAARDKWVVGLQLDGKRRHVGRYSNEIEAAQAYDKAAREAFGEFAYLNFNL